MTSWAGKVAVITGGASGIGLATARHLAGAGASVVVADVAAVAGREAADEVSGRFVATDVADPASWGALMDDTLAALGGIDLVHLNAGVTTRPVGTPPSEGGIADLTDDAYRRIMSVNVDGVVFGARAAVRAMRDHGGGAIVATASLAGLIGFAPDPIYTLTKHAVVGFVRALAPQLEAVGITINAVCPGVVDTPLLGDQAKAALNELGYPLIPPSDIAAAVDVAATSGDTGQAWVCQPGRPAHRHHFPTTEEPA